MDEKGGGWVVLRLSSSAQKRCKYRPAGIDTSDWNAEMSSVVAAVSNQGLGNSS